MQFALGRWAKAAEQQQGAASKPPASLVQPAAPQSGPPPVAQQPRAATEARSASAPSMPGRAQPPALTADAAGAAGRQSQERQLAAEIDAENAQAVHSMQPEEASPHISDCHMSLANDAVRACSQCIAGLAAF